MRLQKPNKVINPSPFSGAFGGCFTELIMLSSTDSFDRDRLIEDMLDAEPPHFLGVNTGDCIRSPLWLPVGVSPVSLLTLMSVSLSESSGCVARFGVDLNCDEDSRLLPRL